MAALKNWLQLEHNYYAKGFSLFMGVRELSEAVLPAAQGVVSGCVLDLHVWPDRTARFLVGCSVSSDTEASVSSAASSCSASSVSGNGSQRPSVRWCREEVRP